MNNLPYTITDRNVTVFVDGKPRTFPSSHGSFADIKAAVLAGDEALVRQLTDVKGHIAKVTMGRVKIFDTEIEVDGRVVSGLLVDRILEMVRLGSEAIGGYVAFLDNLLRNPSKTSVDELYLFIEACDLPITPDGHFLAYKRVRANYTDIHSGQFDNSVGKVCEMARNEVDDVRNNLCSSGLHFCSYNYLPHFGSGPGNRVVVVKINPADVVSIPADYNNSKGRTWRYEVVGEIEDWENERITPWYTDEYDEDDYDEDEDHLDDDLFPLHDDVEPQDFVGLPVVEDDRNHDGDYSQKLTWDEVRDMREIFAAIERGESDLTLSGVAEMYGISRRQAARIRDGESWIES